MRPIHWVRALIVAAIPASVLGPALGQPLRSFGSEFQVHAFTPDSQVAPRVALDAQGDFVVLWTRYDSQGYGVFARRFTSGGVAQGDEFRVNSHVPGDQGYSVEGFADSVALDADGDFVVVWSSSGQDGSGDGIFARRFTSAGAALALEFQVNLATEVAQTTPDVAVDPDGDFVVVWRDDGQETDLGIRARRFDAAGTALGGEIQVNLTTFGTQASPSVDMNANGDFLVVWQSDGQDGSDFGIFARGFQSTGVGSIEFQINTYTTGLQRRPAVAVSPQGQIVIAWEGPGDGSFEGIFAQRFTSNGARLGGELQINEDTFLGQTFPDVGVASNGKFVVTWTGLGDGSGSTILARLLGAAGDGLGSEFVVNSYTGGPQLVSAVSVADDGRFVVTWMSGQDGSLFGIFGQRYAILSSLDIDGNGSVDPLTDGILVLRFQFGFTGAVLVAGAVDLAGCSRCDATTILAYLQAQ